MIYMLIDITLIAIHSDTIQICPLHLFPICFVSAHVDIFGIQLCFIQVPWRNYRQLEDLLEPGPEKSGPADVSM